MILLSGGPSRGYQQGNSHVYSNRTYKNNNSQFSNNDYSRTSHKHNENHQ